MMHAIDVAFLIAAGLVPGYAVGYVHAVGRWVKRASGLRGFCACKLPRTIACNSCGRPVAIAEAKPITRAELLAELQRRELS